MIKYYGDSQVDISIIS